ncbi:hypothetical protein BVRB_4g093120 [Beta vulgaris subsp. vulgaris]|uniref:Uncharacterized protein n=1 Tax=Beta vulgaris subsp. vulgaris TaxID=3555 RepID=A0A0J8BAG4_BETVV|nr:uncharacterized protein LOC104907228 [Beta vulgaris subsp. vulgaris]KMS98354.1 hypothetical protein BVRB_4g093120 [Beta vulgaris subsp. vulgaris]
MAKNRNKKKNSDQAPMDTTERTISNLPQAMDTSESVAGGSNSNSLTRKVKKGVQMKRSRNVRKKKAIAKAISKDEKCSEKVLKLETKKVRVHSAKSLYD